MGNAIRLNQNPMNCNMFLKMSSFPVHLLTKHFELHYTPSVLSIGTITDCCHQSVIKVCLYLNLCSSSRLHCMSVILRSPECQTELSCSPHHPAPSVALLHGCPGSTGHPENSLGIFRCSLFHSVLSMSFLCPIVVLYYSNIS